MMIDYSRLTEALITEVGPEIFTAIARAVTDCSTTPQDAEVEAAIRWCYLILADVFIQSAEEYISAVPGSDLVQ